MKDRNTALVVHVAKSIKGASGIYIGQLEEEVKRYMDTILFY